MRYGEKEIVKKIGTELNESTTATISMTKKQRLIKVERE